MLRKSAKIEIFHNLLYLMVFINKFTLLTFPFSYVVHPSYICWYAILIFWSITLMVKSYDDYVSNSSLLSDCSQLIKRGKSLLKASTLIHPPSQCQQLVSEQAFRTKSNSLKEIQRHTMDTMEEKVCTLVDVVPVFEEVLSLGNCDKCCCPL